MLYSSSCWWKVKPKQSWPWRKSNESFPKSFAICLCCSVYVNQIIKDHFYFPKLHSPSKFLPASQLKLLVADPVAPPRVQWASPVLDVHETCCTLATWEMYYERAHLDAFCGGLIKYIIPCWGSRERKNLLIFNRPVDQIFDEANESLNNFSVQPKKDGKELRFWNMNERISIIHYLSLSDLPVNLISDLCWIFTNVLNFHKIRILKWNPGVLGAEYSLPLIIYHHLPIPILFL